MKNKIISSILAFLTLAGGIVNASTQYDFNDTFASNFTAINGSGVTFTDNAGVGVMTNTGTPSIQSTTYQWNGVTRTAAQSWVLSVDATATAVLHNLAVDNGAWASLGIIVANSNSPLANNLSFQHYVGDDVPSRGFETTLGGVDLNAASASITPHLRLSYSANTKILSALSESGAVLRNVNVQTTWGMSDTDTFLFGVSGYVEYGTIPTDQNYASLDDLRLEDILEPSGPEIVVEAPGAVDLVDGSATVDFGTGLVGSSSDAKVFTVRNTGTADLTGLSVSVSGEAAADYTVDDTLLGSMIAGGESATFSVTFSPSTENTRAAALQIASNDVDENPFDVALTGEGTTPLMVAQEAYLKGQNTDAFDSFGGSVAISGDTIVVGAWLEGGDSSSTEETPNDNAQVAGAAYVFERSGTTWTQTAYLKASNADAFDYFGVSVAIAGDIIVVGAPGEDGDRFSTEEAPNDNYENVGAAYIFERSDTTWTQKAYLKVSPIYIGPTVNEFGTSVAISGDTVVVGARMGEAAHVFVRGDATWSLETYLMASNWANGDYFGNSVAISGDTVVVGASGAAYVFERSGTIWTQEAYLKASNGGTRDAFGGSVAISGDTVVVGAEREDGSATSTAALPNDDALDSGAAYVFTRSDTTWSQEAYLKASNAGGGDRFGNSIVISDDTLVVGAHKETGDASSTATSPNNNLYRAGATYLFVRSGTNWSQKIYLKSSNAGNSDQFGESVALSGNTLVVGARGEYGDASSTLLFPNDNAEGAGAAYVFNFITAVPETFTAVASGAGLTDSDALPLAIPFNDGVPNLLKYAFNMNLAGADSHGMAPSGSSGLPGGALVEYGGHAYWRVQYVRRVGSGLVYMPKKSTTLEPGSFAPMTGISSEEVIDANWVRVTIDEPYNPLSTPKCFSLVEVSLP